MSFKSFISSLFSGAKGDAVSLGLGVEKDAIAALQRVQAAAEAGVTASKADAAIVEKFLARQAQRVEESLADFYARIHKDLSSGYALTKADLVKLGESLRQHLHLTELVNDFEDAKNAAEQEADALKTEWERETAAAREAFASMTVADAGIEYLHTLLADAGIQITDPTQLEAIEASIKRRLDKSGKDLSDRGPASATAQAAAAADGASSSSGNVALVGNIALAGAPVPPAAPTTDTPKT